MDMPSSSRVANTLAELGIPRRNHLLPFFWQHGDHHDRLEQQVARIADSGAGAFCVESRPHRDFCGDSWWADMDVILDAAQRRHLEVWLLDDNHFPTGNANGEIARSHPDLRAWRLVERHVDVMGPARDLTLLVEPDTPDTRLLAVWAYPRRDHAETLEDAPIELTAHVRGEFLTWDVPAGCHRVFFLSLTHAGALHGQSHYIDMLRDESVDVLLSAVYEPHFQHYGHLFGKTFRGFFSDEPCLGNSWGGRFMSTDYGMYNRRPGQPGLALPWSESFVTELGRQFGESVWTSRLPGLWYPLGEATRTIRANYMELVSCGYRDHFVRRVGDWCRAHGVEYIGHVIEDQNAHARLGHGTAHYFRAEDGQDMSGMDIVLHQVMPGLGAHIHSAICFGGTVDPDFFQCTLPKMCASAAHLDPRTHGRAMCEVFGAFGWAEGAPFMKWLMDFLLVRGVNEFVPHAFSPAFPDGDCPPHFGAEGHDPQFGAFTALMQYSNTVASLLAGDGCTHLATAALLYHAEAEWLALDDSEYLLTQLPARQLMQAHIDFDIVPVDAVCAGQAENHRLRLAHETFDCLVIPGARHLPERLLAKLAELRAAGVPVLIVDMAPDGWQPNVTLQNLGHELRQRGLFDVELVGDAADIRHLHLRRGGLDIVYLVNESTTADVRFVFRSALRGPYLYLDAARDRVLGGETACGDIPLDLCAGESCALVFGMERQPDCPPRHQAGTSVTVAPLLEVALASHENLSDFQPLCQTAEPLNITGPACRPDFSGHIRYRFSLDLTDEQAHGCELDLGEVGQAAALSINGTSLGWRFGRPFAFDLTGVAQAGHNDIEVLVANTLGNAIRDPFSRFMPLPRSGMMGPLRLTTPELTR